MSETLITGVYGNVGTPRFYMLNTLEHLLSGVDVSISTAILGGDQQLRKSVLYPETWSQNKRFDILEPGMNHLSFIVNFPSSTYVEPMNYMAVLGERFFINSGSNVSDDTTGENSDEGQAEENEGTPRSTVTHNCGIGVSTYDEDSQYTSPQNIESLAGWGGEVNGEFTPATYGGFGILTWDANTDLHNKIYFYLKDENENYFEDWSDHIDFSGLTFGTYYEMPFSPDLAVKMSWEYDGVKTTTTKGGATLSNAMYHKPPDFGKEGYFVTYGGAGESQRSGRRTWDLSFNYISDEDLEPTTYYTYQTLRKNDDFYSRVINRCWGSHIPFIFQPDKNKRDFALCRFDQDSFERTQVAPKVYKISLKIRESW